MEEYTYTLHLVGGRAFSFILVSRATFLACSISSTAFLNFFVFTSLSRWSSEPSGNTADVRSRSESIASFTFSRRWPSIRATNLCRISIGNYFMN